MRTSTYTEEIEVPHELGNYYTFKPLTAEQVDEVGVVGQERIIGTLKMLSGVDLPTPDEGAQRAFTEADPLIGMGRDLLVRYGVVAWRGPNYDGAPCDEAGKIDLDVVTRDWAALTALEVSRMASGESPSSAGGTRAVNGSTALPRLNQQEHEVTPASVSPS